MAITLIYIKLKPARYVIGSLLNETHTVSSGVYSIFQIQCSNPNLFSDEGAGH